MDGKVAFKGGMELQFFADPVFESCDNNSPKMQSLITIRNALRLLMMGWPVSWKKLISISGLKAIFIQRNPELLKLFRLAFQQGFEHVFSQLEGRQLTVNESEQVQLYLSNCLSLLPYADLTPYESIKIPQCINGEWHFVEYYVTPIELTTGKINDSDRVFAYGLEPISHANARSHLIFMGTTYPAGQGFFSQIVSDLEAFKTVGCSLYLSGRTRIHEWLMQQKEKVEVCGVSLGGSLSLLLAIDLGEYLFRVDALNPAGLHELQNKTSPDHWDELKTKPQVVIQQQANDPVSIFGVWKPDWDIIQVKPPVGKKGPNLFCDHFMNYAGFAETEFQYVAAEHENLKRTTRNLVFYSTARGAVYYFGVLPYNYLIRPVLSFIGNNQSVIAPLSLVTGGFSLLLGLTVTGILTFSGTMIALSVLSVMSFCLFLPIFIIAFDTYNTSMRVHDKETPYAKLHDPALSRNAVLDIYSKEHQIDVTLTTQQWQAYKAIKRLLQSKENPLKEEDKLRSDIVKKEFEAEQSTGMTDQLVTVKKTKAKAVYIKKALSFLTQLGCENEQELKRVLENHHKQYCLGKHALDEPSSPPIKL